MGSKPVLHTKSSVKCIYTNAQCLSNKLAGLIDLCHRHSPDLIAITETWFQSNMTDSELAIPHMSLLRRDRLSHGGGVALYYDDCVRCYEIPDTTLALSDTLWCTLQLVS